MTGLILKLVLLIVVLRALLRLFRGIVQGLSGAAATPQAVALVRDPVCGTFVLPESAVTLVEGRARLYFCSDDCREKYRTRLA